MIRLLLYSHYRCMLLCLLTFQQFFCVFVIKTNRQTYMVRSYRLSSKVVHSKKKDGNPCIA